MAGHTNEHQAIIKTVVRKSATLATLSLERLGFEIVTVKSSGSKHPSKRLIRPVQTVEKPKPVIPANHLIDSQRYFTVNVGCQAGINHMKSALSLLIKESLSLNRTPLVFAPRLLPTHNFGKSVDSSWDKYIALDKISIVRNGTTRRVRVVTDDLIGAREGLSVLEVNGKHHITESENAEYTLIVRNTPSGLGLHAVYGHGDYGVDVEFVQSDTIIHHAERVIRQLGEYHSLHVRRGDKLGSTLYPHLEADTKPEKIYQTVSQSLPRDSVVYVLTDEKDPSHFDVLKNEYRVFRYFDFRELRRLVEGDNPDNFFLYEVEQLIFERAKIRIYTFAEPGGKSRISLTSDVGWT